MVPTPDRAERIAREFEGRIRPIMERAGEEPTAIEQVIESWRVAIAESCRTFDKYREIAATLPRQDRRALIQALRWVQERF